MRTTQSRCYSQQGTSKNDILKAVVKMTICISDDKPLAFKVMWILGRHSSLMSVETAKTEINRFYNSLLTYCGTPTLSSMHAGI